MSETIAPPHLPEAGAPETGAPETDVECNARHRALLREMADLGIRAARIAVRQIEAATASGQVPSPVLSLVFARASNVVRQTIALEQRIMAGPAQPASARATPESRSPAPYPSPAAADPRRIPLRDALHKAAIGVEPDRTARTHLCRRIDQRLDAALLEHPEGEIQLGQLLVDVANQFGIQIQVSKLPDSLLGVPPQPRRSPAEPPPKPDNPPQKPAW